MASILAHRNVNVPLVLSAAYLRRYVQELFSKHKGVMTLSVASPVRRSGSTAAVREEVVVDFAKMVHLKLLTGQTAVVWRPVHGSGMIPSFSGQLTLSDAESPESCLLSLEGSYTPPLGPVGAAFDAILGHTIASNTAQRLLTSIAQDLENMHRETRISPIFGAGDDAVLG